MTFKVQHPAASRFFGKPNEQKDTRGDYKPSNEELDILKVIQQAYVDGEGLLYTPLNTYSDKTPVEIDKISHEILNIYKPDIEKEIHEVWMSDVRRPISRNKVVAVVAHEAHKLIIPSVIAQNQSQEHDVLSAQVMRDILDYIRHKSQYKQKLIPTLLEATASPLTFLETGYRNRYKVHRTVRDGKKNVDLVIDDELSGFFIERHNFGEILLSNINEADTQKQDWIIKRKLYTYSTVKSLYGLHKNFKYVSPGTYYKFADDGTFYLNTNDAVVSQDSKLVEVVTYYNRVYDLELVVANGVLLTDYDQPMRREDKLYPFAKTGYEPITREAEALYYPFILKLKEDQYLLEDMYNLVMDGVKLDNMPPLAVTQQIGTTNVVPGASIVVNEGFQSTPLVPGRNIASGFTAIQLIENSFEQVSPSHIAGVRSPGEKTRKEVELLDTNASVAQALFRANNEAMVIELTKLMINDAQEHITKKALEKIASGVATNQVISIPEQDTPNGVVKKEIHFVSPLASYLDEVERSYKLLEMKKKTGKDIVEVNPLAFLDLKFSVYISPAEMQSESPKFEEEKAREMYMFLKDNPTVDIEGLTRHFVHAYAPYQVDKIMKDPAILKKELQARPENTKMPRIGGEDNLPVSSPNMPSV